MIMQELYAGPRFILGIDLGQLTDFTAITILEQLGDHLHVGYLDRLPLGMSYPDQVNQIDSLVHTPPLNNENSKLIVDATGVGLPVVDLLRKNGLYPVAVSISSGDKPYWESRHNVKVPKRDLISNLIVQSQTGKLKIAAELSTAPILAKELLQFRVKIDLRTAHDSYGTWREGQHDDLVLAVALALWWAKNRLKPKLFAPRICFM